MGRRYDRRDFQFCQFKAKFEANCIYAILQIESHKLTIYFKEVKTR
jgi:hypothetical protein